MVVYMNCSMHKTMAGRGAEALHVDDGQDPTLSLQWSLKRDFESVVNHPHMTNGGKGVVDSITISEQTCVGKPSSKELPVRQGYVQRSKSCKGRW